MARCCAAHVRPCIDASPLVWRLNSQTLWKLNPKRSPMVSAQLAFPEKAVGYWLKAGRNAASRSANLEAIAHLRRGIDAIAGFAEDAAKDRLELDFQFALGPCLIATRRRPASAAVSLETFLRARTLCERLR